MEFDSLNSALNTFAQNMSAWPNYGRQESGTGDDYKKTLIERTQLFYSINDCRAVITDYKSQRQYPFWAVSECLTEIFALNPPLMMKYKPDVIEWAYKLQPDKTVEYSYGSRWAENQQLMNTIRVLKERNDSKRAVMTIFDGRDTNPERNDVPCTLMYDFKLRNKKLNMTVFFRSHDIFSGLKYDVILSSFMNQIICMGINAGNKEQVAPGALNIYEGSLHCYPMKDEKLYKQFLEEAHPADVEEKFDIMYNYASLKELFDDLWLVKKVEEETYMSRFDLAFDEIGKIKNPAFRDFARVYYNRNYKFAFDKEKGNLEYETKILKWNGDKLG
jgi:thymidylate synthase